MSLVLVEITELDKLIRDAIKDEVTRLMPPVEKTEKLYTINQARKKMQRSFETVKNMVINSELKATPDGRIPESEIQKYLEVK